MRQLIRQTTRECVHLLKHGHFWSRDKDSGRGVRSAIAESPMLLALLTALSFVERDFTLREY